MMLVSDESHAIVDTCWVFTTKKYYFFGSISFVHMKGNHRLGVGFSLYRRSRQVTESCFVECHSKHATHQIENIIMQDFTPFNTVLYSTIFLRPTLNFLYLYWDHRKKQ